MRIIETFKSLQGEGSDSGTPAFFVRLTGCNVHCPFCDTKESWDVNSGIEVDVEDLIKEVKENLPKNGIIVITGGEPFLQTEELREFLECLSDESLDHLVRIETSASAPISEITLKKFPLVELNISPKFNAPANSLYWDYFPVNEFRFAVEDTDEGNKQTLNWFMSMLKEYPSIRRESYGKIYLSPIIKGDIRKHENELWIKAVADFCKTHDFRFSLQIHKLLGIQ